MTLPSIRTELKARLAARLAEVCGEPVDPLLRPAADPRFGDYQSNCAMSAAKRMGRAPRDLAAAVVEGLAVEDLCEPPQVAGPGFINLRIKPAAAATRLASIPSSDVGGDRVGIGPTPHPISIAIDLSSPNLAKEMHVGHLRSTVIGDAVARVLEFMGHTVHRINHVGDWGTQFGMLVAHVREDRPEVLDEPETLVLGDLEQFYVEAKNHFDRDPEFAKRARRTVVELQGGDPATRSIWKAFCDESMRHCDRIYERLGVRLENRGESFYNDKLPEVVRELRDKGLIVESDGAQCIFLDGFRSREGEPQPIIVQKSDGGYNYDTTDLAAVLHRLRVLGARRLIYVVGAPQKHHFEMLFAAVRLAGWADDDVRLEHLPFGSMLDQAGRPFRTRTGGTVKLAELLDEAVARARAVMERGADARDGNDDLDSAERERIAEAVGIGAVKYFDLSHNVTSDYRFDWDTMLAMEGNTAPYMLYAYARIKSIGRKAGIDFSALPGDAPIVLEHDAEVSLGKTLLRFADVVEQVERDLAPNVLTDYLFELSKRFSTFYDRKHGVRVIDARPEPVRLSRLRLCDLTARTLRLGLGLLGIDTVERM